MNSIKKIIKLFLSITIVLNDLLRILIYSKFFLEKREGFKKTSCLILGNGPSLLQSINDIIELSKSCDTVCVNSFILQELMLEIKPTVYVLADPVYFKQTSIDRIENLKKNILYKLNNTITWKMTLYVPYYAKHSDFIKDINNEYFKIIYYNPTTLKTKFTKFKYFFYNIGLAIPRTQTVLNAALYIAINQKYKRIFLAGADADWHTNLYIDQKTNELSYIDTHFYGKKQLKLWSDLEETIPSRLHIQLASCATAFESYWELRYYSEYIGLEIFNLSNNSWIDAFLRATPSEAIKYIKAIS
ncbi:MAG: 6-hydroxymethylpterin diphosphokinase MptE-like protein [Sulfuricurvum sp.]|jgi:hypothetical protein